ncbi:hypothetical protein CTAYLR_010598 [Chrysophaeum taylorii]|uniref:Uncharacterized protein n=1 Tax=Chrysophaeum taylorii TaxID=2483200 RepID=A0AAD7XJG7_9STRA|nr:hypothetical protein CTAYLR_010598 [Chrysophaeum taylorii]
MWLVLLAAGSAGGLIEVSVSQVAKLTAHDAGESDRFGATVSLYDGTVVSGAKFKDEAFEDEGAVYVFNATLQLAKIVPSDGGVDDEFGGAVAVYGNRIVVGARYDDDVATDAGAAYVFEGYVQIAKFTASDGEEDDHFGRSVAIFNDTVVVGAYFEDGNGTVDAGAAYVFDLSTGTQVCKLTGDSEPEDYFGSSVAVYNNTIVVGASRDDDAAEDAGALYVFEGCRRTAKLTASDAGSGDYLGESVGIYEKRIVSGARFHDDLASNAGAVYVFDDADPWSQVAKLTASDAQEDDWLGRSRKSWRATGNPGIFLAEP